MEALYGLLLPFLGTSLGAASVFFMKKAMSCPSRMIFPE